MNTIVLKTNKGEKKIGLGEPVFIVAEMSGNHNQSLERAFKIIDAAVNAGVDAIKLQTYTPDTITINSDTDHFKIKTNNVWRGQTLYSLYQKAYTPWKWQKKLKKYGEKKGLVVFSTPFDETAVDFLETLNVPMYKISSYEVIDIPLLKKIGKTKKPVIMSRGMASAKEIKVAIQTLKKAGTKDIVVLHCVNVYPALPSQMNLSTIPDITKKFKVLGGLSDHTLGINTALAATALGATVIEKHLTLKRKDGGPDSSFSIEQAEFKQLVKSVREIQSSLGKPTYGQVGDEKIDSKHRRSIFVVSHIKKGEKFTRKNIRSIRPGYGLLPEHLDKIIGKKAKKDIPFGTPLQWNLISNISK